MNIKRTTSLKAKFSLTAIALSSIFICSTVYSPVTSAQSNKMLLKPSDANSVEHLTHQVKHKKKHKKKKRKHSSDDSSSSAGHDNENTYDYIVVGAGSAGSVVAARLGQAGYDVLVVEQGKDNSVPDDFPQWYEPLGLDDDPNIRNYLAPFNNILFTLYHFYDLNPFDNPLTPDGSYDCGQLQPSTPLLDYITPNQNDNGRYYAYPRGAGAGGSSLVAAGFLDGIGSLKIYDQIANEVNDQIWRGDNILRIAKKMEKHIPARDPNLYGHEGWLKVGQSTVESADPIYSDIIAKANAMGIPTQSDFRAQRAGIGLLDSHIVGAGVGGDGYRSYSYKDLLQPVLANSDNIEIKFNTLAAKVLLKKAGSKKHKVIGVEVLEKENLNKVQIDGVLMPHPDIPGLCVTMPIDREKPSPKRYYARKEVIVSAGTFQTPQLLMLSGIGDKDHIESVGVKPKVHLPGVGKNVMDHTEMFVMWEMDPKKWVHTATATLLGLSPYGDPANNMTVVDAIVDDDIRESYENKFNPLSLSESVIALQIDWFSGYDSTPDPELPDMHAFTFPLYVLNFDAPDFGPVYNVNDIHTHSTIFDRPDPNDPLDPLGLSDKVEITFAAFTPPEPKAYMGWIVENLTPGNSTGSITLRSNDPTDEPLIDMGLYRDEEGLERLARSFLIIREIMEDSSIKGLALDPENYEVQPGKNVQSIEEVVEYIKTWTAFGHHPSGSAKMGACNDPMAVLDSRLKVRNVDGLRVADVSVYPTPYIHGYNTTRGAYIVGELAAEMIIHEDKKGKIKVCDDDSSSSDSSS